MRFLFVGLFHFQVTSERSTCQTRQDNRELHDAHHPPDSPLGRSQATWRSQGHTMSEPSNCRHFFGSSTPAERDMSADNATLVPLKGGNVLISKLRPKTSATLRGVCFGEGGVLRF